MPSFAARVALLFALAPALLGAGRPAPPPELGRLLDRMRDAAGPVWSTHFVSISRITYNGEQTVASTESEGLSFWLRRCSGELCDGTFFDGKRLYDVNANETTLPQTNDAQPYLHALRLIASLAFLAPDFRRNGGRIAWGGDAPISGRKYPSILLAEGDSIPVRVFVDPSTGLIKYARDLSGGDTFEYRDYRHVDGFTVPFEVLHNGTVLEKYDDRTPVATAFHGPRGLSPTFQGDPLPVPYDPNRVTPIFNCAVGGIAVKCLLDSGNSGLSISSELASRLDAPVIGSYTVRGLGGYSTQVVRTGPLLVGNAIYPEADYVVLNDIRKYGYDAVLGADFLASSNVEIDAKANTIRLGAKTPDGGIAVPLTFQNFVPVVEVGLGSLSTKLAVDTGDESNINLAYDYYTKHSTLFTATEKRAVAGVGGTSFELIGQIPEVTIGNHTMGPQKIGTTQTLVGTAFGHLGAAFLEQFTVVLDYPGAKLHLLPKT